MSTSRLLYVILFSLFSMTTGAENRNDFEKAVREAVHYQMKAYPRSTLRDLYKSFFQDRYGPGHLINDTVAAGNYLSNELNSYSIITGEIAEPTGWQHNFYRVNLSVIKNNLLPYEVFLDAFIRSANGINPIPVDEWKIEWGRIETVIRSMKLSLPDYDKDSAEIEQKLKDGNYAGHHSEIFNKAYTPHYRIISKQIFEEEILPLLEKTNKGNESRK